MIGWIDRQIGNFYVIIHASGDVNVSYGGKYLNEKNTNRFLRAMGDEWLNDMIERAEEVEDDWSLNDGDEDKYKDD